MRGIFAILTGLGIGAALMYLFDPEGGNRRRALIRDKAVKFNRQTKEALDSTVKDLSNRAKGTVHGLKSTMAHTQDTESSTSATNWSDGPAY
jgi:gas vesicle protein